MVWDGLDASQSSCGREVSVRPEQFVGEGTGCCEESSQTVQVVLHGCRVAARRVESKAVRLAATWHALLWRAHMVRLLLGVCSVPIIYYCGTRACIGPVGERHKNCG